MRPFAQRAFTLVELVTAASLMTIMMIGVVQVFGIITQTAADAEGLSFAQQQARVLFDRLNRDVRGMTREGYLYIAHNAISPTSADRYIRGASAPIPSDTKPPLAYAPEEQYFCDTLAFVTIGQCWSVWTSADDPQTNTRRGAPGAAAEVVYTSNVPTPTNVLEATCFGVAPKENPRKGILARGQWMWDEGRRGGGVAIENSDRPGTNTLADLFAAQAGGRPAEKGPVVHVWPWRVGESTANTPSLRRVVSSCVSEFYVEVFNPKGDDAATNALQWKMAATLFTTPVTHRWKPVGSSSWPRAIRVTVAFHDPADRKPIRSAARAQGYAFQEIFWLTDP
jgi:type II secretory pathway pseudopilin PulG